MPSCQRRCSSGLSQVFGKLLKLVGAVCGFDLQVGGALVSIGGQSWREWCKTTEHMILPAFAERGALQAVLALQESIRSLIISCRQ